MSRIADYIKRLAESEEVGIEAFLGTVTSVDEDARTCNVQPLMDDAEFKNVWLQGSSESTEGVLVVPKVDSEVVCIAIDDFQAVVINTTSVEKVLIDTDLVQFNGGDNDGMVKVNPLVTKLNNIENWISEFSVIWTAHVHTDPLSGTTGPTSSAAPTAPTQTIKSDLENTNITQ